MTVTPEKGIIICAMSNLIIWNRRAKYDYRIIQSFQAGLNLTSKLVKEISANKINISGKFIIFQNKQLQVIGLKTESGDVNVPLLLKKREVFEIKKQLEIKGLTCIILSIKRVGRWYKAEIAVVKGKSNVNKKHSIKERDIEKEAKRELKNLYR